MCTGGAAAASGWLLCAGLAGLILTTGTASPALAAESVDDNDGSTPAVATAADLAGLPVGAKCYTSGSTNTSGDNWFYIHLANRRNVHVLLATCVFREHDSGAGDVCARIYVGWWPGGDSDPLDLFRFNHLKVRVQLQRNNATVQEFGITDDYFLNDIDTIPSVSWWNGPWIGSGCVPYSTAFQRTADGWVQRDKNDDGQAGSTSTTCTAARSSDPAGQSIGADLVHCGQGPLPISWRV